MYLHVLRRSDMIANKLKGKENRLCRNDLNIHFEYKLFTTYHWSTTQLTWLLVYSYVYYNNHRLNIIDSLKYIIHGIIIIIPIIKGNSFVQQNDINWS
jgi:hypothetical protein